MKQTKLIMGMPISVEIVDPRAQQKDLGEIFAFFRKVDRQFSPFRKESEVSKINRGEVLESDYSPEMKEILKLAEKTKNSTNGYFDIHRNGKVDPSGVVKGWAIANAAKLVDRKKFKNYYINAGGDIQVRGKNSLGRFWRVGIENPFNRREIVKILELRDSAIATSGSYIRGEHIYNPKGEIYKKVVSLSVLAADILKADLLATAAFAMGEKGIDFIEKTLGVEGYQIGQDGFATKTSRFNNYLPK